VTNQSRQISPDRTERTRQQGHGSNNRKAEKRERGKDYLSCNFGAGKRDRTTGTGQPEKKVGIIQPGY
jgi:hypothetical protein